MEITLRVPVMPVISYGLKLTFPDHTLPFKISQVSYMVISHSKSRWFFSLGGRDMLFTNRATLQTDFPFKGNLQLAVVGR